MTPWGWNSARSHGFRSAGLPWLQPYVASVPWITVGLLFLLICRVGDTFTRAKGVAFDLPSATGAPEGAVTQMVALVMPDPKETKTLVFFDDARYTLGDWRSERSLDEELSRRAAAAGEKTLLVLADRRVPAGDVMGFAEIARRAGVKKLLFAEKSREEGVE